MTLKKYLIYSFLVFVILIFVRVYFLSFQIFSNLGIQQLVFWGILAAVAVAFARRFGIINYLEAIFLIITWTLGGLFLDLLITTSYTGIGIFYKKEYWLGYLVMDLAVFMFHKKRHIQVRKLLQHSHHH